MRNRRSSFQARSQGRRRGFTLIEVSLVIVIVGVGVLAAAQLLAVGTQANADSHRLTTGLNLAANVREWAQQKTADQIVAVNGQTYTPPRDARNEPIVGLEQWQQVVAVRRVNPDQITATGTSSSRLVELKVSVNYRGEFVTEESWIIADTAE